MIPTHVLVLALEVRTFAWCSSNKESKNLIVLEGKTLWDLEWLNSFFLPIALCPHEIVCVYVVEDTFIICIYYLK